MLNGEQELASKWLETASAQGSQGTTNSKDSQDNQSSQDRLAAQYMSLVAKADRNSQRLAELAEQGYAAAQNLLGDLCYEARPIAYSVGKEHYLQALEWYKQAAAQGHADALYSIGHMYAVGEGVEIDQAIANYYFKKAALLGHEEALSVLAFRLKDYDPYQYYDEPNPNEFAEIESGLRHRIAFQMDLCAAARGGISSLIWQCYAKHKKLNKLEKQAQQAQEADYDRIIFFVAEHDYSQYFKLVALAAKALYFRKQLWNMGLDRGLEQALEQLNQFNQAKFSDFTPQEQREMNAFSFFLQGLACYECLMSTPATAAATAINTAATAAATATAITEPVVPVVLVVNAATATTTNTTPAKAVNPISLSSPVSLSTLVCSSNPVSSLSPARAEFYFERALFNDEKFAPAKFFLGEICFLIRKDYEQALTWYHLVLESYTAKKVNAAKSAALYRLGTIYEQGLGVEVSYEKALGFYTKSTKQPFAPAQLSLGRMYLFGKGVPQDFSLAESWYSKAAAQGFAPAQNFAVEIARVKAIIADVSPATTFASTSTTSTATTDVSTAVSTAVSTDTATSNNSSAINTNNAALNKSLKELKELEESLRLPPDDKELIAYINHAVFRQTIHRMLKDDMEYNLGQFTSDCRNLYHRNLERKYACLWDIQEYISWFKPAALDGDAYAQYMLGLSYASDDPLCYALARYWLEKAAQQGIVDAQIELDSLQANSAQNSFAAGATCDFDGKAYDAFDKAWCSVPSQEKIAEFLTDCIYHIHHVHGQRPHSCKIKAQLIIRDGEFVLLKNSNVYFDGGFDSYSGTYLAERKLKLLAEGKIVPQSAQCNGCYVLTEDCVFKHAYDAARFVLPACCFRNDPYDSYANSSDRFWKVMARQPLAASGAKENANQAITKQ